MTTNVANNVLKGHSKFRPGYKSSKTRVCVTVGMMTTGYDCEDILNLALLRPVFSPTDFVQMKGRGTRKFTFKYKDEDGETQRVIKDKFKFFDFFANFEYFEENTIRNIGSSGKENLLINVRKDKESIERVIKTLKKELETIN